MGGGWAAFLGQGLWAEQDSAVSLSPQGVGAGLLASVFKGIRLEPLGWLPCPLPPPFWKGQLAPGWPLHGGGVTCDRLLGEGRQALRLEA